MLNVPIKIIRIIWWLVSLNTQNAFVYVEIYIKCIKLKNRDSPSRTIYISYNLIIGHFFHVKVFIQGRTQKKNLGGVFTF